MFVAKLVNHAYTRRSYIFTFAELLVCVLNVYIAPKVEESVGVKTEVSSAVPSLFITENVMAPQFTPDSRFVVIKESLHVRSLCGYQTF